MREILFMLLPVAAFMGWYLGKEHKLNKQDNNVVTPKYLVGLNFLLEEQPDKAVDVFLEMLEVNDEIVDIHFTLGNLFRKRGEVDRAIRIHQGLMARPDLSKQYRFLSLLELAKDYISAGLLDRAENLLLELIKAKQHVNESLGYLLDIYQQGKEWLKAIDIAYKLQSHSKQDLRVKISHFYCELAEQSDVKTAKKYLKQALKINPNGARPYIVQANLEERDGNINRALKLYKQASSKDSRYVDRIIQNIQRCYAALNDKSIEMYKYFEQYLQQEPCLVMAIAMSDWLNYHKSPEEALAFINKYLQQYPSIKGLQHVIKIMLNTKFAPQYELKTLQQLMTKALSSYLNYRCKNCGFVLKGSQWQCPSCKQWDTVGACGT